MNARVVATLLTVIVFVLLAGGSAVAQTGNTWTPPRTPWSDPDLQGIWDFRTLTPLERPSELAGKEFLTDEEAAVFTQGLFFTNWDNREGADKAFGLDSDIEHGSNQFWMDFGTALTDDNRTSLIIDPPDGRIPWVEGREGSGGYGDAFSGRPPAGPEDRALPERCLMGLNSGPPMRPGAYNQNVQVFQIPGYVVLLNEMIHNARIVPLDGRPHGTIPQWVGDSRGHWDGDTLVVETTNFLRETHFEGSSANLHLVERFTRVGAESLVYEFTVEDPRMWTRRWTVQIPMRRTDGPIYEYACHEGNYGLVNQLAGARAQEKVAEEAAR